MRKKWKYADVSLPGTPVKWLRPSYKRYETVCFMALFTLCIFCTSSCSDKNEHKHIPSTNTPDLENLTLAANQTVFSDVKTIVPELKSISLTLHATGVISYDPTLLNTISARYGGRIEKRYVRYNFQPVNKGERIMDIYSPDMLNAQKDYIFLLKNPAAGETMINSAKQKLELLGFTEQQFRELETSRQIINPVPLYSPYNGHIHDIGSSNGIPNSRMNNGGASGMNGQSTALSTVQIENLPSSQTSALTLKEGMYIEPGQSLFSVYDISRVWAVLNIFPQDAAFIKEGMHVLITAETNPEHTLAGTINYIEPVTGSNASAIKARVYLSNPDNLRLKIGTILSAKISTSEIKGMWLPRKSVIDLGQKQIVFIKDKNHFNSRYVHTGTVTDSLVQILSGLEGNELVADDAQFLVDSESFIQTTNDEKK